MQDVPISNSQDEYMKPNIHQTLLQEIIDEASQQPDIIGILLTGSVARGDALPGSDLDLRFLLTPGSSRPFSTEWRQGILVERGYADISKARRKLESNPMEIYGYLDGHILFDPQGVLADLREQARQRFAAYRVPDDERREIAHWLLSSRIKLTAALAARDTLKAAYLASTVSWQLLQGLWAANEKPVPPNGSVWVHLKDLSRGPQDVEEQLKQFLLDEPLSRAQIAINLINWILEQWSKTL
jgi:hypothetical protein